MLHVGIIFGLLMVANCWLCSLLFSEAVAGGPRPILTPSRGGLRLIGCSSLPGTYSLSIRVTFRIDVHVETRFLAETIKIRLKNRLEILQVAHDRRR